MSSTENSQPVAVKSAAGLVRYLGRIVELSRPRAGDRLVGLLAAAPRSLADPAQGFRLAVAEEFADPAGDAQLLLTNEEVDSAGVELRPLGKAEAAAVRLSGGERNPFDRGDEVSSIRAAVKTYELMAADTVAAFTLGLHDDEPELNRAWIACSAALALDGELARRILSVVLPEGWDLGGTIYRLRNLPGVWKEDEDRWIVAEDVRPELNLHLRDRLPLETVEAVRRAIADYRDEEADRLEGAEPGGLRNHRLRNARHEAAYQRTIIPSERARGARDWRALWEGLDGTPRRTVADAVLYLAPQLEALIGDLPADVRKIIAGAAPDDDAYRGYKAQVSSSIRALGFVDLDKVDLDEYADLLKESMALGDAPQTAAGRIEDRVRATRAA